jgi:DHA1 family bicyclomycin/chloramphenicol resistance-like MFS transporter
MTIAMVRDKFEGRSMARVISFVMAVFIPPSSHRRSVRPFSRFRAGGRSSASLTLALVVLVWFALRQEETLSRDRRRAFSAARLR